LDDVFAESGWTVDSAFPFSRIRTAGNASSNNIQYRVDLWVGRFKEDNQLKFNYLNNPNIDYTQPGKPGDAFDRYFTKMTLGAEDWDFSPYKPKQKPGEHLYKSLSATQPSTLSGSAWATVVTSLDQFQVTSRSDKSAKTGDNQNFKKLVLRIKWSGKATGRHGLGDHDKELWLISFRANLGGIDANAH
ncbi:MAG: hypothetical protein HY303_04575, partial [Candidatus Wallbacteria bacterium]|nr:hypothetical protein [Candidatus Wallbacteria bacterium]